jgi:hypothetical protein
MARERGKNILLDAGQCKAVLADYAKNDYKKERHLLLLAIEVGVARAIAHAADPENARKVQGRILRDDHFIDQTAAAEVVDLLAGVLRGAQARRASPPPAQTVAQSSAPQSSRPQSSRQIMSNYPPPAAQPASQPAQHSAFADPSGLTKWVRRFLYLDVGISALALISGVLEYQLLQAMLGGAYVSNAQVEANDARQKMIGLIYIAIWLVLAVLILKWIYRANFNARQLGASGMQFTPGWSVGWYFIPVACLWKPYQAMNEIWKASANPQDWQNQQGSPLLGWWWFLWIVFNMIGWVLLRMPEAKTIEALITANVAGLFSFCVEIISCLVLLALVNRIHEMQMHQSRRVS